MSFLRWCRMIILFIFECWTARKIFVNKSIMFWIYLERVLHWLLTDQTKHWHLFSYFLFQYIWISYHSCFLHLRKYDRIMIHKSFFILIKMNLQSFLFVIKNEISNMKSHKLLSNYYNYNKRTVNIFVVHITDLL